MEHLRVSGFSLFVLALLWTGAARLAAAQNIRLYVADSEGDDITVIDLQTMKTVDRIALAPRVHGLAVQADGRRLFATVESDHSLRLIDTATDAVVSAVQLTGRPNQCAVTPDGKYVAVPIRDGDSVDLVDVAAGRIAKVLPVSKPHNAFSAGSNRYLFVSSMGADEVEMIDLEKMAYAAHIGVGGVPRPYVISADGRTLYAALSNLHGFVAVDIPANRILSKVEIPAENPHPKARPFEPADVLTHGLALSPVQKELWVTSLLDNRLYIYDTKKEQVTGWVATGDGPNWVAFSPDGKYVAVSNADSGDVSIIDAHNRRESARIKAGKTPKRILIAQIPAAGPAQAPPRH